MTYATLNDLLARFGAEEIERLGQTRAEAALADASAEINASLAGRYTLPLSQSQRLLTVIAGDLARARLYDDSEHEPSREAARQARKLLLSLQVGDIALPGEKQKSNPERGARYLAPKPIMPTFRR